MKKINCIIADDESLAREIIEGYIARLDRLNLVATCANGTQVYNTLKEKAADLLFLDIKMPQLTGIELLRTTRDLPPVIITTAYREFAVEGYEFNVIDYLVKPISFERFLKAIEKYESTPQDNEFIDVKADKKRIRIPLQDILYVEGLKDYVKIVTTGKPVVTYLTLTQLEAALPKGQFIRVHRSYILSIKQISAWSVTHIELGKTSIPIGAAYRQEVLRTLEP